MKLYLMPDACSLAVHVLLRELEIEADVVRVDSRSKRTSEGGSFLEVNPDGYVAALVLDSGEVLTEVTAILVHLAGTHPHRGLLPDASGPLGDYPLHQWLNFISSELQARFDLFFLAGMPAQAKDLYRQKIVARLDRVARQLEGRAYLIGDRYSIIDGYLFTIVRWSPWFDIDLARWPSIVQFIDRIGAREATRKALQVEAQLKAEAA